MNRAHTITTTTIDRWLMPYIAGVLSYADTDPTFAVTLATWLDEENWSITPSPSLAASQYLVPTNADHADDIIDWLMHELATHPEARIARSQMVKWSSEYQAPQDLIYGMTFTDKFGPTITGQPNKKTRSQLQVVVNSVWQEEQPSEKFAELTQSLSQELVASELRKAGGKVGSLHPDTAEWCMGGAGTKLYIGSEEAVKQVYEAALGEELHHQPLKVNGVPVAIAISPSVNDELVEELF